MQKGTIGVTTENIFPVIKKFLYSDHEIFLRELVSNAVDATQKLRTLSSFGEFKGELGDMKVEVKVDKEAGTLTVSDSGVGMDAEDIDRYINQIAFSGAEEFLKKYKDTANTIIGHFGLGFYSAFMVAKKVVIRSLSYKEGAEAVEWTCDGSPEFTLDKTDKATRGTDIILYIDDDNKQYLEQSTIDGLLRKYCRFLPVPVVSGFEQEWKEGKMVDTERPRVINSTEPAWMKKPADLTKDDYLKFYHDLYPGADDPLFWIHLNVDYPFNLTGILYFPKIKNNIEVTKDRIQLYCRQVYVTDSVEGVVPEFMTLLKGVIDSPDIPLNVSRSYLQADTAVKKISGYITRKVAARLEEIFTDDRADFEKKWDDIRIFIEYGMLTDEKFCEAAMKFVLLKDTEGHYYTLDQYRELTSPTQTDKDSTLVWLYATDKTEQYPFIKAAVDRGYNVLLLDGQLDTHFVGLLESKLEKTRFVRVDSDSVDRLIPSADTAATDLSATARDILTPLFRSSIPSVENANFVVAFEKLGENAQPVTVTRNEYMRRMKEMAAMQPGMNFYGELPDSYTLVVNTANPLVKRLTDSAFDALKGEVEPVESQIKDLNDKLAKADKASDKKVDGKTADELSKEVDELRKKIDTTAKDYAAKEPLVRQLTDLALLSAGLLRGEPLTEFVNRSLSLLK